MNLSLINFYSQNISGQQFKNNLPAKNNVIVNFGKRYTTDEFAFSKPRSDKSATINELLKRARIGKHLRFTPEERFSLSRELRKFDSRVPATKILNSLLDMEYNTVNESGNKEKLSVVDIASFFSVLGNKPTCNQVYATLELMEFCLNNDYAKDSSDLDELVFLPLEDNPDLIKHLGNSRLKFKDLPADKRGEFMHYTLDIVTDSDYKYNSYSPQIIKTIAQDKSGGYAYRIMLKAAENQLDVNNFGKLLKSLTPEKLEQIKTETANLPDGIAEHIYIDNYIEQFEK